MRIALIFAGCNSFVYMVRSIKSRDLVSRLISDEKTDSFELSCGLFLLKFVCRPTSPFACCRHRNILIIEVELLRNGQWCSKMHAKSIIIS